MSSAAQHYGQLLALFASSFVGLIFVFSGGAKLPRPGQFVGVVRDFRLVPDWAAKPVAYALPCLELGVGLGLLFDVYRAASLAAAAALLSAFTFAIAVNLARGRTAISCGCFGSRGKTSLTRGLVVRNVLLVALTLAALGPDTAPAAPAEKLSLIVLAGALLTSYYLFGLIARFWRPQF
jgi:hypothetical protein